MTFRALLPRLSGRVLPDKDLAAYSLRKEASGLGRTLPCSITCGNGPIGRSHVKVVAVNGLIAIPDPIRKQGAGLSRLINDAHGLFRLEWVIHTADLGFTHHSVLS